MNTYRILTPDNDAFDVQASSAITALAGLGKPFKQGTLSGRFNRNFDTASALDDTGGVWLASWKMEALAC